MKVVFDAVEGGSVTNARREEDDYILKPGENILEGATDVPVTDQYSIKKGAAIVEDTAQMAADQAIANQMQQDIEAALPGWAANKVIFDALLASVSSAQTVSDLKTVLTSLITAMEAQVKAFNSVVTLMRKIWS